MLRENKESKQTIAVKEFKKKWTWVEIGELKKYNYLFSLGSCREGSEKSNIWFASN